MSDQADDELDADALDAILDEMVIEALDDSAPTPATPAGGDLRLNSISRFEKRSPTLILEEHGHCEVPAGCGGAVLSWRDPAEGDPYSVRVHLTQGTAKVWVDGEPILTGRPLLHPGDHVLSLQLGDLPASGGQLAVTLSPDPSPRPQPAPRHLVSSGDGVWRWQSAAEPDAESGWQAPGFDDSPWSRLAPGTPPPESERSWSLRHLLDAGVVLLDLPPGHAGLLVRTSFRLEASP